MGPAPCSVLRVARCAAWRIEPCKQTSSSVEPGAKRSPPPLLPAPEAACFSTAPELGRLRHLVARLAPQAASKRQLDALSKAEAAAAKAEEKAACQRDMLAEQVRASSISTAPKGDVMSEEWSRRERLRKLFALSNGQRSSGGAFGAVQAPSGSLCGALTTEQLGRVALLLTYQCLSQEYICVHITMMHISDVDI